MEIWYMAKVTVHISGEKQRKEWLLNTLGARRNGHHMGKNGIGSLHAYGVTHKNEFQMN